jgi:pimeloyl-ACP methyl ester carboxylesterase
MAHITDEYPRSVLKSIKSETRVFSGTEDRLHSEASVRAYASNIPDSKLIKIRNCSHLVHEEKYAAFNEEALKFLKKANDENAVSQQRSAPAGIG